ncbi:E3 ubiquitin-protein ligase SP1-like [Leptopilina heterotoma]|uniref:E3 ubiquitin-protein ligase SP1-like n=1 Tax=Leptopilina heterotoma TaxID=63436 RepID=UPI001CA8183C|nr:E3 ubiquitin-protein ligase SP1-like [Leptopilina heterotoma]
MQNRNDRVAEFNRIIIDDSDEETEAAVDQLQNRNDGVARVNPIESDETDEDDEGANNCCICRERERTHAFIPCGHKQICDICKITYNRMGISACPLCRKRIMCIVKIIG